MDEPGDHNNGVLPEPPMLDLSVAGLRTFRAQQPYPKRMRDDDLRSVSTPVLLLFGGRSPVNRPRRATERARRLIPGVETDVVPDAGHMLPVEEPAVFTDRVLGFVGAVDARR